MSEMHNGAKNPIMTGVRGCCPRCGERKLFRGFLKLAPRCEACGQDYRFADPGDRPAYFALTVMSFPAVGFALWLDSAFGPPW